MSELTFVRFDRTGTQQLARFRAGVSQYRQQWIEGPSEASWRFELSDSSGARSWFRNNFLHQIRVYAGGSECWRGWVWRMEASGRGGVYEASMDDVYNRILTRFGGDEYYPRRVFEDDDEYTVPVWLQNVLSTARYGPMEHVASTATNSATEAAGYARGLLARHGTPYYAAARSNTLEPEHALTVTCVGAATLANRVLLPDEHMLHTWSAEPDGPDDRMGGLRYAGPEYAGLAYGATTFGGKVWTVADEFRRIVRVVQTAWGGVVYPLDIAAHDRPTAAGCQSVTGAFDRLRELAGVTDMGGHQYVMQLTVDGGVSLRRLDTLPVSYYAYMNDRGTTNVDGSAPRWMARPGIVQDVGDHGYLPLEPQGDGVTVPLVELPPGQYYAERVDMAEGEERASFSPRRVMIADTRRELDRHLRWQGNR